MVRPISPERRHENQLIDKATRELFTVTDLVEKLRNLCLQRGVEGELLTDLIIKFVFCKTVQAFLPESF